MLRWVLSMMCLFAAQLLMIQYAPAWIATVFILTSGICVILLLCAVELLVHAKDDFKKIINNQNILGDNMTRIAAHLEEKMTKLEKSVRTSRTDRGDGGSR